jgi:5-methylcytosine-specific restriction protein A
MPTVEDVAGSLDAVMGVKAVFGRSGAAVMCFGSHGDENAKDKGHFSLARRTAEKAIERPFLISIGGGDDVPPELRGRVLELLRITGVFGETKAFVSDEAYLTRLQRWPVAVVTSEVYEIVGEPLLIEDLHFPDRKILANAYDGIRHDESELERLWDVLRSAPVRRRWEICPLPGFRDPGRVQMFSTLYPKVSAQSSEGKKIWKEQQVLERDKGLSRAAKTANREANGGRLVCEACALSNVREGLFDAHHLNPLACGIRQSRVDDFAILCPTCHRWAHLFGPDKLQPLSIAELRNVRAGGSR